MNYAELDEIYESNVLEIKKNQYNDIIKNITNQNYYDEKPDEKFLYSKYPTPKKKTNKIKEIKVQEDVKENYENYVDTECDNFLEHILTCEKCKEYILQKYNMKDNSINNDDMLDVAIYILTGIFVLFILDSFISLGKFLKYK